MTARSLSITEDMALNFLQDGRAVTAAVASAAGLYDPNAKSRTATARAVLKRLERWGLVVHHPAPGGGWTAWWEITEAGRRAVQP